MIETRKLLNYAVENQAMRDFRVHQARLKGFEVIEGTDYSLLLDLDRKELSAEFYSVLSMFLDRFTGDWEMWHSKSGNIHVRITLDEPLPLIERIALQAMLGSDPRKEMMSLFSARIGVKNPVLLFKPGKKLLKSPVASIRRRLFK